MSHFGRHGPPDIVDTYSLLILNISFRTTADDLFPYFDKYGKVVDIFIPKDRSKALLDWLVTPLEEVLLTNMVIKSPFTTLSRSDEAQKAVDRLDGKMVDGREIMVQFAKYGPNAERISKGRIIEKVPRGSISRSRSPRRRTCDDYYGDRDYYRRRSRSRSYRERERSYRRRSLSRSASPDCDKGRGRGRYVDERRRSKSPSYESASPPRGRKSLSPRQSVSPDRRSYDERSPTPRSVSPRRFDSRGPSPGNSE